MLRLFSVVIVFLVFSFPSFSKGSDWVYVVTEGDNLWDISQKYLTKVTYFEDVRKLNNIQKPKAMQPGTLIRIPLEWVIQESANVSIKSFSGDTHIFSNNKLSPINLDTKFTLGDELRVGKNATATIVFADNSEMTLSDDVIVTFDHLTHYGETGMVDTRVRLSQGKMEIRAEKQRGVASRLDIATASAITSVRGTIFRVGINKSTSGSLASTIEVIEGEVAVSKGNKSVAIKEGFGLKVNKNEELAVPVKLLSPPELIQFSGLLDKENELVRWNKINGAVFYHVQISKDPLFSKIVWQKKQRTSELSLPNLTDGIYYFRVSGVTNTGIEGIPSETVFELNAFPLPPTLNETPVIHLNGDQKLSWQQLSQDTNQVIIQISKYKNFSSLVTNKRVSESEFRPSDKLEIGNYFWRVANLEQPGSIKQGPYSPVGQFRYTLLLPPPELKAIIKEQDIFLSWKSLPSNQYVEIETAKTVNFDEASLDTVKDTNKITLDVKEVTYLRARARLKGEPIPGQWSNHCKISAGANLAICGI